MQKKYCKPITEITPIQIEYHLCEPSTWGVGGSKTPIKEADPNDEEPTGAKEWHGGVSAWDTWED
jgi:hypothetical protein